MKRLLMTTLLLACLCACKNNGQQTSETGKLADANPFSSMSTLPYHAPPFDKIKDADYKPALEEGMRQQLEEIKQIADNPAAATFENTMIPLEKSGQLLSRVHYVFNLVTGANNNDNLQKVQEEIAPKLAAHRDAINEQQAV